MDSTERARLPLLAAGQVEKEIWHNEALVLVDLLVGGLIEGAASDVAPTDPEPGSLYLVGPSPSGVWSGHGDELAGHTDGGWRFIAPFDGLRLTERGSGAEWVRRDGAWEAGIARCGELRIGGQKVVGGRASAIAEPVGGVTIDAEARACLSALLTGLRGHGLIEI